MLVVAPLAWLLLQLMALPHRLSETSHTLDAIERVESGCRTDLVGDGGRAIGSFQVWEGYWKDAVEHDRRCGGAFRISGAPYSACRDRAYARRVVLAYLSRYHATTPEKMARTHNGGPRGASKKSTLMYWKKVCASQAI